MDYRERVQQLQREVKQLYEDNEAYRKKRFRTPHDNYARDMRGERLKQILAEFAEIANRKKP